MKTDENYNLILNLKLHDELALQAIYYKYAEQVYKFSFLLLKDTGWSEDVVQEVFVKLWNNRSNLDPEGNLWTYLFVLTKRASLNKLRDIKAFSSSFEQLWDNISRLSDCSHEKLVVKELSDSLEGLLNELPDRQREVFKLSRYEGFTHQEIAKKLNISPNTVKNHMVQALKTVKKGFLWTGYIILFVLLRF